MLPLAGRADDGLDFTLPLQAPRLQVAQDAALRSPGANWRLAEHRGAPVWLVVVAPWCGGCSEFVDRVVVRASKVEQNLRPASADSTAKITTTFQRQPPLVIAISATERGKPDGATLADQRVPVLVDRGGAVLTQLDPRDLPWVLVIDEDGRITASGNEVDALADGLASDSSKRSRAGTLAKLQRWWKR